MSIWQIQMSSVTVNWSLCFQLCSEAHMTSSKARQDLCTLAIDIATRSMVLRLVGFLSRGEASSMAAASGFTSRRPCTRVLYRGLPACNVLLSAST